MTVKIGRIYDAVAKDITHRGTDSRQAIVGAMTAYCLALKASGRKVPLWSESGLLKGVHARLEGRI